MNKRFSGHQCSNDVATPVVAAAAAQRLHGKHALSGKRLILCGGGTGGHVYPALSVLEALRQQTYQPSRDERLPVERPARHDQRQLHADILAKQRAELVERVVYLGSIGGMEERILAQESDIPFRALPAAGIRGRSPQRMLGSMTKLAAGTLVAQRLLAELRPAAILGTGGYVCVPIFLAAYAARIPVLIYAPDVIPALSIRVMSRIAAQVACGVEDSLHYLPDARVVGYPVRPEFFAQERAKCRAAFGLHSEAPVLLVYGGSRGARSINRAVQKLLPSLLASCQIIHVCGREGDEEWLRATAAQLDRSLQARYHLFPYLPSTRKGGQPTGEGIAQPMETGRTMVQAFGASDVALCRSGASTIGELPALGIPSVLVPYPYVNQEQNADYLVRHGAAVMVADAEMLGADTPEQGPLFRHLQTLLTNPQQRAQLAERCRALARPHAATDLADMLLALAMTRREDYYVH